MNRNRNIISIFLILALITTVTNYASAKDITTDKQLTPEEVKILKELISNSKEKSDINNLNLTERMKRANVPSKLINISINNTKYIKSPKYNTSTDPYSLYGLIAYNNPVSGISTQGTGFTTTIGTNDYVNWASWNFYLPENSFTYVDISGNVGDYKYYTNYVMNIDYSQYTDWVYTLDFNCQRCGSEIQRSKIFYLMKGWHTINLNGYADRFSDSYWVQGFISMVAFPEYTAIKVNSPNGKENWPRGSTKTISWTIYGRPGNNVVIELYKGTALSTVISSKTPNDGSYSWYIPTYQPTGNDYQIKVKSYEESKYKDSSDNNFIIS